MKMLRRTQHLQKQPNHLHIIVAMVVIVLLLFGVSKAVSHHESSNQNEPATQRYDNSEHMASIKTSKASKALTAIQNNDKNIAKISLSNGTLLMTYEQPNGFNKFKAKGQQQYQKYLTQAHKTSSQIKLKIVMSGQASHQLAQQQRDNQKKKARAQQAKAKQIKANQRKQAQQRLKAQQRVKSDKKNNRRQQHTHKRK